MRATADIDTPRIATAGAFAAVDAPFLRFDAIYTKLPWFIRLDAIYTKLPSVYFAAASSFQLAWRLTYL